ncbi:hypothetical protein [Ruegeria arenilitoris]|uniref:hypothetical protein n=1 Tax=Ruegeria arenilitoris TaxID=1173585 RepID=UPI00147FEE4D|nr:hypothetical protein [Ruegeria arenilitoris]
MQISFKELVSFGSLVLSVFALVFSTQAKQKAQELDELVFRAETVHQLLKEVHDNTTNAENDEDKLAGCLYAGALAKAEERVVQEPEQRLVLSLFLDQVDRGLLPQNCVVGTLEFLENTERAEAPDDAVTQIPNTDGHREIGSYHALIASYPAVESSCDHATDDVKEFAKLLEGMGLKDRDIYVARTVKSNSYAVTVDAGNNKGLAVEIVTKIKSVAPSSVDGRTGHDSFVQINSDWYIDPECTAAAQIKS